MIFLDTPIGLTPDHWISICGLLAAVLIPIGGGLIFLIFRSGKVIQNIEHIDSDLMQINKDLRAVKAKVERIVNIEKSIETLWQHNFSVSKSPIQLNEKGLTILENSGIKNVVEQRFEEILNRVKAKNPQNAYEVQEITKSVISELFNEDGVKEAVEGISFLSGTPVIVLSFIGATYIRDKVLTNIGFNLNDIDKFEPLKPRN